MHPKARMSCVGHFAKGGGGKHKGIKFVDINRQNEHFGTGRNSRDENSFESHPERISRRMVLLLMFFTLDVKPENLKIRNIPNLVPRASLRQQFQSVYNRDSQRIPFAIKTIKIGNQDCSN